MEITHANLKQLIDALNQLSLTARKIILLQALYYKDNRCDYFGEFAHYPIFEGAQGLSFNDLQTLIQELKNSGFYHDAHSALFISDLALKDQYIHPLSYLAVSGKIVDSSVLKAKLQSSIGQSHSLIMNKRQQAPWLKNITYLKDVNRCILHYHIYMNDETPFQSPNDPIYTQALMTHLAHLYGIWAFDAEWLDSRKPLIKAFLCVVKLDYLLGFSDKRLYADTVFDVFERIDFHAIEHDELKYHVANIYLQLGRLSKIRQLIATFSHMYGTYHRPIIENTLQVFQGHYDQKVIDIYEKAKTNLAEFSKHNQWFYTDVHGLLLIIGVIYIAQNPSLAIEYASSLNDWLSSEYAPVARNGQWLSRLAELQLGHLEQQKATLASTCDSLTNPFDVFGILSAYLAGQLNEKHTVQLAHHLDYAQRNNWALASHILAEILESLDSYHAKSAQYLAQTPFNIRFLSKFSIKKTWEYQIDVITRLLQQPSTYEPKAELANDLPNPNKRILWVLEHKDFKTFNLTAYEQRVLKNNEWSKGRALSLKKLYHESHLYHYLTEHDRYVLQYLTYYTRYRRTIYYFDITQALPALEGHPNVVLAENPEVVVSLSYAEPELKILPVDSGYQLILSHHKNEPGVLVERLTQQHLSIVHFRSEHVRLNGILSKEGTILPAEAKDHVIHMIQNAGNGIKIQASIEEAGIKEIEADTTLCVQCIPLQEHMQFLLRIKPLGADHAVYCSLGEGSDYIVETIQDGFSSSKVRAKRNLVYEQAIKEWLLDNCSILGRYEVNTNEYIVSNLEDILTVVSFLSHSMQTVPLYVEWPEGKPYHIQRTLNVNQLALSIYEKNNWFAYEGSFELDKGDHLSLDRIFDVLNKHDTRFIPLDQHNFIELSHHLKHQLDVLRAASQNQHIHKLGADVLKALVDQSGSVDSDKSWKRYIDDWDLLSQYQPVIPENLNAELRDYQKEGFYYLARMAYWGIGVCLADDMGLGKTIQAIALILKYANQGPTLVVAPTSVCFNWEEEIKKFAPTLISHSFYNAQRYQLVESLTENEVVIVSYALVQKNIDLLKNVSWAMIILDEAQAIKNAHTKRWKAVMQLEAEVRLALTGTPIENHLTELWSIFNFINPGFLGNLNQFQQKFINPIENQNNKTQKSALKQLVKPYILRRIKSDVLKELPSKTEQTIYIEPTEKEAEFYHSLRYDALKNIQKQSQKPNHQKRMNVLAELVKLRQACCDASLVDADMRIDNSKLQTFKALLSDIIDNGHKVLVFSQYVRFLSIVKQELDQMRISYQSIDGSMTPSKRSEAVNRFQSGQSYVFLLSLKTGGSGLNLTKADYVIHLDPWWNPAVEDQASDRAHRIGQTNPVTIYRLIMKNTIEDKIMQMHKNKRDLANELLSGQDLTAKMSDEELLSLIKK
jgi:superfamily II DNA or RNA helicase